VTDTLREALDPRAFGFAAALGRRAWAGDFYLAGGAALALRLGHRRAAALDLMSGTNRLVSADRRDLLADLLDLDAATRVETARDGYLFVRSGEGVALRLFWYPYPLVAPTDRLAGLETASLLDLALMKLGAVISRGSRRDFVDLFAIDRELPLAATLARSDEKFGHVGDFPLQALKALADLGEAESEPMPPDLLAPLDWAEVRAWALAAAARGGREALAAAGDAAEGRA